MKVWVRERNEKPTKEGYYNTIVYAGEFTIEHECLWLPGIQKWVPREHGNLDNVVFWEREL